MPTTLLGLRSFPAAVSRAGVVLVDFGAVWCRPCVTFAPVFEAASRRHPDVTFATVDTDAEQELAAVMGIRSLPTVLAFRDGVLAYRRPGLLSPRGLDQLVAAVREVGREDEEEPAGPQPSA